jgi:anthranilate phosphoribosyltransferase
LNSAAALVAGGVSVTLEDGVEQAAQVLDSGAGLERLDALVEYSQRFAVEVQQ